jgi:hypothetical protein
MKMIFNPKINQKVRVHYRKSLQSFVPCEGLTGTVVAVSKGPGPRNVAIKVMLWPGDNDEYFVEIVPRGNLQSATL